MKTLFPRKQLINDAVRIIRIRKRSFDEEMRVYSSSSAYLERDMCLEMISSLYLLNVISLDKFKLLNRIVLKYFCYDY